MYVIISLRSYVTAVVIFPFVVVWLLFIITMITKLFKCKADDECFLLERYLSLLPLFNQGRGEKW